MNYCCLREVPPPLVLWLLFNLHFDVSDEDEKTLVLGYENKLASNFRHTFFHKCLILWICARCQADNPFVSKLECARSCLSWSNLLKHSGVPKSCCLQMFLRRTSVSMPFYTLLALSANFPLQHFFFKHLTGCRHLISPLLLTNERTFHALVSRVQFMVLGWGVDLEAAQINVFKGVNFMPSLH